MTGFLRESARLGANAECIDSEALYGPEVCEDDSQGQTDDEDKNLEEDEF